MRKTPRKFRPIRMMMKPPILARISRFWRNSVPIVEAPAPSATKTVAKPSVKKKAENSTALRISGRGAVFSVLNCSTETPAI
ncbi:hypothetical protein D3C72_1979290 [compost metagenome]